MSKNKSSADARLAKAMAHPLRFRVLEALNEHEASPSLIAERLGEKLGNVSYHVKVLLECDAIELVSTRPVRGAVEHFYRAIARPYVDDDHWSRLPESVRAQLFDTILQGAWEHLVEGSSSGGFDDPLTHISWTTLELDQEGYEELADTLVKTVERALEIKAESAGRLVELDPSERKTRRTELTIFHFDRPSDSAIRAPSGRVSAAEG